ncbi:unknown [Orgyia pseudotsugata multiple nucleopolyhedrovirus]|uniref:Uncharacterized 8.2 kDa protein n=1 Tax=Orgyia pseudotsugata multicapsid polyhedrosis virus TaxID=262177 RepID=Y111_NPVOP|nr:hypothetical protein OpmnVgp112 [Orgyia pseudotsugata multiple nucleopolyhedrovirus]O10351.1 RecName: Full=Uncharacterized 8.2 kDa protein [Orgyia pseudotsugata multiple nucleopolyhedrovirus]pir/T10381/ hypothetical protein 112 - Orgyia pseudotsugata nuclear polyhedrosis virus [Orgyia pseudotsugata single capsid nuclopolyhedrovirus]AAC59111.1 unknown [Orgyia pseudotsugata multiple nucleopolyhedrovirus]
MDAYAVQHFYNNARKPLAPTTLHSGNLPAAAYENVMFIRKLVCRENAPGAHERPFCAHHDYNKENLSEKSRL